MDDHLRHDPFVIWADQQVDLADDEAENVVIAAAYREWAKRLKYLHKNNRRVAARQQQKAVTA